MENDGSRRSNIPMLVAALMASGTTGAFSLYGSTLKASLDLTQGELDTISSATFLGGLLSWIPGLFVDRFGCRASLITGGTTGASSLLLNWVVAKQMIVLEKNLLVTVLSALGISTFISSALVTGAVFKIIVSTCGPGSKGSAVGGAKGYVGVGSAIYSVLLVSLRGGLLQSDLDFLPMAALFAFAAAAIPACLFVPGKDQLAENPTVDCTTPLHFRSIYIGLISLAILIVGNCMLELFVDAEEGDDDTTALLQEAGDRFLEDPELLAQEQQLLGNGDAVVEDPDYLMAIVVVVLWFGPCLALLCLPTATHTQLDTTDSSDVIPLNGSSKTNGSRRKAYRDDVCCEDEMESNNDEEEEEDPADMITENAASNVSDGPEDRNLSQMLGTLSAWLMLYSTTILVGGGTIMTNQMGEMTEALGFHGDVGKASVALFSVCQSFARVATGGLSESALSWNCGCGGGIPRPAFFMIAALLGASAHTVLASATSEVPFVIGVALSGLAFGMVWPLLVLVSQELFGTTNAGANYMFYDGSTSALGTVLLSNLVAQKVYDDHIVPDEDGNKGKVCIGEGCFQTSHLIVAGLALSCFFTSSCLLCTKLTKQAYRGRR